MPVKFSEFLFGGDLTNSDIVVGLKDGKNTKFTPEGGSGGLEWFTVSVNTQMAPNSGYVVTGNCTLTLPVNFSVGDQIEIIAYEGMWSVAQNSGQSIRVGIVTSTSGVTGSISSHDIGDVIILRGVLANTVLMAVGGVTQDYTIN